MRAEIKRKGRAKEKGGLIDHKGGMPLASKGGRGNRLHLLLGDKGIIRPKKDEPITGKGESRDPKDDHQLEKLLKDCSCLPLGKEGGGEKTRRKIMVLKT